MQITVVYEDQLHNIEVLESTSVSELFSLVAALTGAPVDSVVGIANNKSIDPSENTVASLYISQFLSAGDCLLLVPRQPATTNVPSSGAPTAASVPAAAPIAKGQMTDRMRMLTEQFSAIKVGGKAASIAAAAPKPAPTAQNVDDIIAAIRRDQDGKVKGQAEKLLQSVRERPSLMGMIELESPEMASAVRTCDQKVVEDMIKQQMIQQVYKGKERQSKYEEAMSDPMSAEAQALFFEEAQRANQASLWRKARAVIPEQSTFTHMLYLPVRINGVETDAFIDTGAQASTMSVAVAKELGIMHMIDQSHQNIIQGVGMKKSYGTIPVCPIVIGGEEINTSIEVLEELHGVKILFGLDSMKRYKCVIDLNKNTFTINGKEVSFHSEEILLAKGIITEEQVKAYKERKTVSGGDASPTNDPEAMKLQIAKEKIELVMKETGADMETAKEAVEGNNGDTAIAIAIIKSMK